MEPFFIHKGIEDLPTFWKMEGIFLLAMLVVSLLSFALISVVPGTIGKLFVLTITIILIVVFRLLSQRPGTKGIKKRIGAHKQPDLIISTKPQFTYDKTTG